MLQYIGNKNSFLNSSSFHFRGIFALSNASKHGSLCLTVTEEKPTEVSPQFSRFLLITRFL